MKKKLLILIILLFVIGAFFINRVKIKNYIFELNKPDIPIAQEYIENVQNEPKNEPETAIINQLPSEYNLNVPFTTQAPYVDWNETFKEACEEASSLMVYYYYSNKEFTKDIATNEILKMVEWQNNNWQGHFDLTTYQTKELIEEYFGYEKVEVITNPSIEDIKLHIIEGRPVIIPVAGRELHNPNFKQPGPIYHMLVIKGYTLTHFITNDPGTRMGEDYVYTYDVIMNALHDWNEEDILQGAKNIIVMYPAQDEIPFGHP